MAGEVYIDFNEGVKRVMNNAAFYVKMLGKFKDNTSIKDLDAALADGDIEKAKIAVHTIKGLAGNLSLTELFKQSLELETQLKDDKINPDQVALFKNVCTKTLSEVEKVIEQNG